GFLETTLGGHPQPVGDIVVQRAMHLTERDAALLAAGRLLRGAVRIEGVVDLAKIAAPLNHRPLVGHGLRYRDELHHLGGRASFVPRRAAMALEHWASRVARDFDFYEISTRGVH